MRWHLTILKYYTLVECVKSHELCILCVWTLALIVCVCCRCAYDLVTKTYECFCDEDYSRLIVRILEGFFRCSFCFIHQNVSSCELCFTTLTLTPYTYCDNLVNTAAHQPPLPPSTIHHSISSTVRLLCACALVVVAALWLSCKSAFVINQTTCCISICICRPVHMNNNSSSNRIFAKHTVISACAFQFCAIESCRTVKWSDKPIQFTRTHCWTNYFCSHKRRQNYPIEINSVRLCFYASKLFRDSSVNCSSKHEIWE